MINVTQTLVDNSPPIITTNPSMTIFTTESSGMVVDYISPTATDNTDVTIQPMCTPPSGSMFPVGTSTVTCTASDAAGNIGTKSFTINVINSEAVGDTIPPSFTLNKNIVVDAITSNGTSVTFDLPIVTDDTEVTSGPTCSPSSGSFFSVGTTTVTCTAKDKAGNQGTTSFSVTVKSPIQIPQEILTSVSVSIGNESYTNNDAVFVTGSVDPVTNEKVNLELRDSNNNLVSIEQISPEENGTYTTILFPSTLWITNGTYTMTSSYGTAQDTATFQFENMILDMMPETEQIPTEIIVTLHDSAYQLGESVSIDMNLSGAGAGESMILTIVDPVGKNQLLQSLNTDESGHANMVFSLSENSSPGSYIVTGSSNLWELSTSTTFTAVPPVPNVSLSTINATTIEGEKITTYNAGEIGYFKTSLFSNSTSNVLITVNVFDSQQTTLGVAFFKSIIGKGESEIVLGFQIPEDIISGTATAYVNAFTDWSDLGGVQITDEVSSQIEIIGIEPKQLGTFAFIYDDFTVDMGFDERDMINNAFSYWKNSPQITSYDLYDGISYASSQLPFDDNFGDELEFSDTGTDESNLIYIEWIKEYGSQKLGHALPVTIEGNEYSNIQIAMGDSFCNGSWEPYSKKYMTETLIHEVGHVLGFDHTDDQNDIMYKSVSSAFPIEYANCSLTEIIEPEQVSIKENMIVILSPGETHDITNEIVKVVNEQVSINESVIYILTPENIQETTNEIVKVVNEKINIDENAIAIITNEEQEKHTTNEIVKVVNEQVSINENIVFILTPEEDTSKEIANEIVKVVNEKINIDESVVAIITPEEVSIIEITTEKDNYKTGEVIEISGTVPKNSNQFQIYITDRNDKLVTSLEITPNINGNFIASITSDLTWNTPGKHTLKTTGLENDAETTFDFTMVIETDSNNQDQQGTSGPDDNVGVSETVVALVSAFNFERDPAIPFPVDAISPTYQYSFARGIGTEDTRLSSHYDIAIDSQDNIYAFGCDNNIITKFDSEGNTLTEWKVDPINNRQLECRDQIATTSNDELIVSHNSNREVIKFDSDGNLLSTWSSKYETVPSSSTKIFFKPSSIEIDSSDNLFLMDGTVDGNTQLLKLSSDGTPLSQIEIFKTFRDIEIDSSDNIHILESITSELTRFSEYDNNLQYKSSWELEHTLDEFGFPISFAIDQNDNFFVIWSRNDVGAPIKIYDDQHNFIVGMENFLAEEMSQFTYRYDEKFHGGGDIKFDSNGNIYLLDWGIHILSSLPDTNTIHIVSNSSNTTCAEWDSGWRPDPYPAYTCTLPFNAQVGVGEIITWVNRDSSGHTVTSGTPEEGPSGIFDSGFILTNDTFSFVFDSPGEYHYFDLTHPWVKGVVTVVEGP